MKRVGRIWEMVVDRDNISRALYNAAEGLRKRPSVVWHLDHADETVDSIRDMLVSGKFRTAKYRSRTIMEPKKREIFILPFFPDRIVQHAVVDVVAPLVWEPTFIYDSYACRKGKGAHRGVVRTAEFVRSNKYDFKYDIRGFYRHIDHRVMKEIVRGKIKDNKVLALLDDIIDSYPGDVNCPIGNLTSQWFGNLYLNELDHYIKEELGIRCYIRYCDDFHVFGNDKSEMRWWDTCIAAFVKDVLKLEFSKRSLSQTKSGCDFLGYRIFKDKILLRKSTALRMKRRMRGLWRVVENGDLDANRLLSILGSLASMLGACKFAQTHNLIVATRMKELYDVVLRKYKVVRGDGHSGNRGRREDENAGSPESGDSNHHNGAAHVESREPRWDIPAIRDNPVLFRERRGETSPSCLHRVKKHNRTTRQPEHDLSMSGDDQDDGKVFLSDLKEAA